MAVATYEGPIREALVAFKDHGRWSLREPLGEGLTLSACELVGGILRSIIDAIGVPRPLVADPGDATTRGPLIRFLLVPVPSTAASARLRDGDHVAELGHEVEACVGASFMEVVDGLVAVRRRRDQVGLGRRERAANLQGSMRATDVLVRRAARPGTAVVLVDDIVTTGASLAEAHRALLAAGIRPWGAAVVAATPDLPRRGRPAAR